MPAHVTCPRCGCAARVGAHHSAHCVQCFTSFRTDTPAEDHFRQCVRCGQTVITRADVPRCETCQRLERQPQGEATRLFTPARNQIPGQLAL
jgi:PHP family Zn ribbon phosphoesterase